MIDDVVGHLNCTEEERMNRGQLTLLWQVLSMTTGMLLTVGDMHREHPEFREAVRQLRLHIDAATIDIKRMAEREE